MLSLHIRPRARRLRALVILAFIVAAGSGAPQARRWDTPPAGYDPVGPEPDRGYFSQLPFEHIDMVNGNLLLSFTDLVLPGNAGMDLRIVRSFNRGSAAGGWWSFGLAGVPNSVDDSGALQSTFGSADGSSQIAFLDPLHADHFVTRDFWQYTRSTRTLLMPNGWTATYSSAAGLLQEVHDPFGNSLTPQWENHDGYTALQWVDQSLGGGETRRVTFDYGPHSFFMPTRMTAAGHTWTYEYNDDSRYPGQLSAVHAPEGTTWGFDYSSGMTVTMPAGGTVHYNFENVGTDIAPAWRMTDRVTGGRGIAAGTWTFGYNVSSTAPGVTIDAPDGLRFTYQSSLFVDSLPYGAPVLVRRGVSKSGTELASVSLTYRNLGFMPGQSWVVPVLNSSTFVEDGRTFTTTLTYADDGRFGDYHNPASTTEVGELTRTTTRTYDYDLTPYILGRRLNETATVSGESLSSSYTYENSTGFLSTQTAAGITTAYTRDAFGNRATTTDANANTTSYSYDWGVVQATTTPGLHGVTRVINDDGTVASETRNGHTTGFTYDGLGRVTLVTPPIGANTTTTYATDASSVTVQRGDGVSSTSLDGFGRAVVATNPAGMLSETVYDAVGRKTSQSYPHASGTSAAGDTFDYDDLGRLWRVHHADASVATTVHSGADVIVTDQNGHATTQHWQAFGSPSDARLASVTDAAGHTWTYTYDAAGSLTRVAAPTGADRVWAYNTHHQLESETQPESGTVTYTYDAVGNLATKTDAAGQLFAYAYDHNNRLKVIDAPGTEHDVTITYDASDNRTLVVNGVVSTAMGYDSANRLTSRTDTIAGHAFAVGYGYDSRDNLTSITYPSGREIDYAIDAANRVTGVTGSGSATYASGITYHPSGAIASYTYGNGTTENVTFDSRYRPSHLTSGPLDLTYAYDPTGNVTGITDPRTGHSAAYGYDALDRLTSVTGFGAVNFSYDALGNRTLKDFGTSSVTYVTSSTTQRLTGATDTMGHESGTFTFDANGNTTADSSQGLTFGYTPFNMLASATVGSATSTYQYDGDGMRAIRSTSDGVHYYVRGGGAQTLAEYTDAEGGLQLAREYVYLGAAQLASIDRAADAAPPRAVHISSPNPAATIPDGQDLTIAASAAVTSGTIARVEFYANGVLLGSAASSPFTFTWTSPTAADYALLARVVMTTGEVATSPAVPITIKETGRVTGVSASPSSLIQDDTTTITVTGRPHVCGAVQFDYGDGAVETYSAPTLPYSHTHAWSTTGTKTVVVSGQGDCLGSASTTVVVAGNVPPTVSLTAPSAGSFNAPTSITLTATAADSDGTVAHVDFYAGTTLLGSDATAPYSVTWTGATGGAYSLTAKAVDDHGAVTTSSAVAITVSDISGVSVSPSTVVQGQASTITVSGNSACGSIQIDFGDGTAQTFADGTLPVTHTHTWATTLATGTKTVTATGQGDCIGSKTATVTVNANTASSVAVTAPASGAVITTGSAATISASASDVNGLDHVAFYANGTLIGTDSTSPYSVSWTPSSSATYALTARAVDVYGAETTSSAVSITAWDVISVATAATGNQDTDQLVTVYGSSACGAVTVDWGDGTATTYAISSLPMSNYHQWATGGTKTITATGDGTCVGAPTTTTAINWNPTSTLTAPTTGETFLTTDTLTLGVSASDTDGWVLVSYFYDGSTYLGSASGAGTLAWTPPAAGTYHIHVFTYDNDYGYKWSDTATITVSDPAPSTVMGVSASSSTPAVGDWVEITVTGTNPCGALQIDTGDGSAPYLPITGLPYSYWYQWWSAGTYTVTATGEGDCSGVKTTTVTVSGASQVPARLSSLLLPTSEVPLVHDVVDLTSSTDDADDLTISTAMSVDAASGPAERSEAETAGAAVTDSGASPDVREADPGTTATLTVDLSGSGSGSVTSSPSGISCTGSETTCNGTFTDGTSVTLTASADSGSTFAGWGGACAGTGSTCTVTAGSVGLVVAHFLAAPTYVTSFYHQDVSGSVRAVTDASGATVERHDYLVFGEETAAITTNTRFAGKERDAETQLDDFGARMFGAVSGRFSAVDPVMVTAANLTRTQGWNRYAYAANNPLRFADPTGAVLEDQTPASGVTGDPFSFSSDFQDDVAVPELTPDDGESALGPTMGIGIEVPESNNVADDPGHTFIYLQDASGKVVSMLSFGPSKPIGVTNKGQFTDGKLPGNADWPLFGNVSIWTFAITPKQLAAGEKAISDFKAHVPNYTPSMQCTSASLSIATKMGVALPSGVGPIIAQEYGHTFYSGSVANPYVLNQQMTAAFGPARIVKAKAP